MARRPAHPRPSRRPSPVAVPARPFAEEVAELLGEDGGVPRWAGRELPPMPADQEQLLAATEQVLASTAQELRSTTRSLQTCCALGWMLLSAEPSEEAPVPEWLLDPDAPVDALDVVFAGASYPGRFRSPLEFSHARDAWLELLAQGPNRRELAQTVAAAIRVCDELDVPVDSSAAWLGLLLRMQQARIGTRPLAAAAMPRQALAGHRAVYGPNRSRPAEPVDPAAAEPFLAALTEPALEPVTAADALRAGLAVLVAATLDELVTAEQITAAGGPLDVGTGTPGHGTVEEILAADQAEAQLNSALAGLDDPAGRVGERDGAAVTAAVDRLGPRGLLAALRMGVADQEPRGTAVRLSVPWAVGLGAGSPLVPVADALLRADADGDGGLLALARVTALAELDLPLQPADRPFHGAVGTALMRIGHAAGAEDLSTSNTFVPRSTTGSAAGPGAPAEQSAEEALSAGLAHAGISELTIQACRRAGTEPPVRRFLEPERQDAWEAAVAEAASALGLDEAEAAERREADDVRWRQMLSVSALQRVASDPDVARQALQALLEVVHDLQPEDRLDLVTGAEAAALAEDLRFNVSLRAFVVTQAGWDVAAAVQAAAVLGGDTFADEVAQVGRAVEADTRAAVEAADRQDAPPHALIDVGWDVVPALAVLFAVALAAPPTTP